MANIFDPPKFPHNLPFYIWQTHMYGTGKIDGNAPAEIFRYRPMPCTPAGDFVGEVPNGKLALGLVIVMNDEYLDLAAAKERLRKAFDEEGK